MYRPQVCHHRQKATVDISWLTRKPFAIGTATILVSGIVIPLCRHPLGHTCRRPVGVGEMVRTSNESYVDSNGIGSTIHHR